MRGQTGIRTVDVGVPEIWFQRDGAIEVSNGFRPTVTMCHVPNAAAVVRLRVFGPQFYRSRVIGDRSFRVSLQIVSKAPVVVGLRIVGLQLDGGGVVGDSSVVLMDAGKI